jgi:hypothetical protein
MRTRTDRDADDDPKLAEPDATTQGKTEHEEGYFDMALTQGLLAKREKSRTLESMKRKKVAVYWRADCGKWRRPCRRPWSAPAPIP